MEKLDPTEGSRGQRSGKHHPQKLMNFSPLGRIKKTVTESFLFLFCINLWIKAR